MHKYVKMTAGAGLRLVQQTGSRGAKSFDCGGKVWHFESYVMQSGTAFFQKFRDRRIGGGGLKKLDARFTSGEHRDMDFFGGDSLAMGDVEAEGFVECGGIG